MFNLFRRKPPDKLITALLAQRLKLFAMEDLDALVQGLDAAERGSPPGICFTSAAHHLRQGQKASAIIDFEQVIQPDVPTWWRLAAWHQLRLLGVKPPDTEAKDVLAMLLEQPVKDRRMILAAYNDHSIRYISPEGRLFRWDKLDPAAARLIEQFLASGRPILERAQPWHKPEPGPPPGSFARLSIRTIAGLHFGQGPAKMMAKDPLGAKVIQHANALINQLNANSREHIEQ